MSSKQRFTGVILAAGQGRRAGGYKPLWPLGQGRVIDRIITAASTVCDEIRVVGGSDFERLEEHCRKCWPNVSLIDNKVWKEAGMFSSLRAGLAGLSSAAFIHPADIPGVGTDVYRALAEEYDEHKDACFRPTHQGRPGHPVLLAPSVVRAVLDASPQSNLREVLAARTRVDIEVDDDLILRDFDTPEAFEYLKARLTSA